MKSKHKAVIRTAAKLSLMLSHPRPLSPRKPRHTITLPSTCPPIPTNPSIQGGKKGSAGAFGLPAGAGGAKPSTKISVNKSAAKNAAAPKPPPPPPAMVAPVKGNGPSSSTSDGDSNPKGTKVAWSAPEKKVNAVPAALKRSLAKGKKTADFMQMRKRVLDAHIKYEEDLLANGKVQPTNTHSTQT